MGQYERKDCQVREGDIALPINQKIQHVCVRCRGNIVIYSHEYMVYFAAYFKPNLDMAIVVEEVSSCSDCRRSFLYNKKPKTFLHSWGSILNAERKGAEFKIYRAA